MGVTARLGRLSLATVSHRLVVLAKWHRLQRWDTPTDDHRVKTLIAKARRAMAKRGIVTHKNTAAVAEPLQAMLSDSRIIDGSPANFATEVTRCNFSSDMLKTRIGGRQRRLCARVGDPLIKVS